MEPNLGIEFPPHPVQNDWSRRKISMLLPVFNEDMNVVPFYEVLAGYLAPLSLYDWELIFVDDGSTDRSFQKILELQKNDSRIKVLRLSRNFGSHSALVAGLAHASGDAAILMSVDLQDPPAIIQEFIAEWKKGAHVVWGMRRSRNDPWIRKILTGLFYRICRKVALANYPEAGIDCSLLDRRVIDTLSTIKERDSSLFATILWIGFHQVFVPYDRAARAGGVSKFSFGQLIKTGIDIIVSFSYFPIRFMTTLGIIVSCCAFLYALWIVMEVFFGIRDPGWPSIMVAILFFSGLQLIMMGVLGEYIWRGTDQVKGRPRYIVMEKTGFEESESLKEN